MKDEAESELLTVHNVSEWLSSLHLVPTSSNTVDVEISEEGFKAYDQYKVEYTTINQLDQWKQVRIYEWLQRKIYFCCCYFLD